MRLTLDATRPKTAEERSVISELNVLAANAAIELVDRELEKGHRRVFVVVVVEPQANGMSALTSGIGYPNDMPVVAEAAANILEGAIAALRNLSDVSVGASKAFS